MAAAVLISRVHLLQQVERYEQQDRKSGVVDKDAIDRALVLCDLMDMLIGQFDHGISCVKLNTNDGTVHIIFDLDCPVFENGRSHPFFQYIKLADRMYLAAAQNDMVRFKLVVENAIEF